MRNTLITTEAVILREMPVHEADRLFFLFSRERGLLRAVAKGVKKPSSKLGGHLDLFYHAAFELVETSRNGGTSLQTISGVKVMNSHDGIRGDVEKTALASRISEICLKLVEDEHALPRLFSVLTEVLKTIADREVPSWSPEAFGIAAISVLGHLPDWRFCTKCNAKLEEGNHSLDPDRSGPICPKCSPEIGISLSFPIIKFVSFLQRAPIETSLSIALSKEQKNELSFLFEKLVSPHLKAKLKSVSL